MATLTIKPTAAGNDVQIKSGDGNTTHATFGDTNNISMSTGSIASAVTGTLGSGITFPAGHVVKVFSATYTASHTVGANNSYINVGNGTTGELNITTDTPNSQSSKYIIFASVCHSMQLSGGLQLRLVDGSGTPISQSDASGNRARTWMGRGHYSTNASVYNVENTSMNYLWSPNSASAQTIKVQCCGYDADIFYINRSQTDSNADWQVRATSSLTIMEIAG